MSTAQVFQATRAALDNSVDQSAFAREFDPGAINATGLNVSDISSQLSRIAGQNKLSSDELAKGAQYYNDNITPFAGNSQWWGPAAKQRAVLQGYGGLHPEFNWQQYGNPALESGQQKQLGESLMAQQNKDDGGLFGGLGDLAPLIGIGALMFGGFDPSSFMSFLGGGEGLGAGAAWGGGEAMAGGGLLPDLSGFAGGGGWGGAEAMAGGGALPEGMNALGGENFAQYFNGAANIAGEGATSAGGPLANGMSGQVANFLQQNPWMRNVFSGMKGAMGNQKNPLMGALMGYGNSMMPGTGGPFSNALGMGSGVLSMFQGADQNRRQRGAYNELNSMGDPMAALRQQGMSRLSALNSDPGGTLGNTPGYKAGMDAITRQRAAMGQLGSGNLATALLDYGGNIFNQERGNAMNQIAMAGDPTRLAMMKAQLAGQSGAGNPGIMNGLATLGFGLNRMGL